MKYNLRFHPIHQFQKLHIDYEFVARFVMNFEVVSIYCFSKIFGIDAELAITLMMNLLTVASFQTIMTIDLDSFKSVILVFTFNSKVASNSFLR